MLNNTVPVYKMLDWLEAGSMGLQLWDLEALLAKEVKHVPVSYLELDVMLTMFEDLLNMILGTHHTISEEF